jgi:hypothetical protein
MPAGMQPLVLHPGPPLPAERTQSLPYGPAAVICHVLIAAALQRCCIAASPL